METYELVLMMAIGLAVLLFGYRLKKIAFFIIWFLLGYQLMISLLPTINNMVPEIAASQIYQTLLPIASGVLLAMLGFLIEKLCVGGICFALVIVITMHYFGTETTTLAIGAAVGIVLAGVAVMMMKPATIIATALAGAYALTISILELATLSLETYYFPILGGLTAFGLIFQYLTTKRLL